MEKVLSEIKALVDVHCGEQAIKTAKAAGAAAAEEVMQTLLPATSALPAPVVVPNLSTPQLSMVPKPTKTRKTAKVAVLSSVPEVTETPAKSKKSGPTLWNEYINEYLKIQRNAGRTISRPVAMAEAGPSYRKKYGIPESTKKPATGVQIAPVEMPVTATPARVSPVKPVGVLNSLKTALGQNVTPQPDPSIYKYNNQGMENSLRKIRVDGEEFFMTNKDRGLFKRTGNEMGEWVGYLEADGEIRETNSPDENIM